LRLAGGEALDAASAEARRALEARAAAEQSALDRLDAEEATERAARGAPGRADVAAEPEVGDAVAVASLDGKPGRLLERRGDDAVVAVGAVKLTVPFGTLRRLSARHLKEERTEVALVDTPDLEVRTEVDVRGLRVHEVDDAVVQALDAAVRADLASLRIIHGKGTGALRERVTQLLKRDGRVRQFRLGAWNEGGAGVTVAEFS
jgi:DNA mismatch repair protein MutS2